MQYLYMLAEANPITVKLKATKYRNQYVHADLRIPVVEGMSNKSIQSYINNSFQNDITEFYNQMSEAGRERGTDPYIISNIYKVNYNRNNILSMSIIYHMYDGRSHSYIKTSYNYDIRTGKALGLRDIFKDGANYRQLIDKEIRKALERDPAMYAPDTAANFKGIAEDQPFYLEDNSLVVYFGFNQIAPTEAQIPVIKIPLNSFDDYIKDYIKN